MAGGLRYEGQGAGASPEPRAVERREQGSAPGWDHDPFAPRAWALPTRDSVKIFFLLFGVLCGRQLLSSDLRRACRPEDSRKEQDWEALRSVSPLSLRAWKQGPRSGRCPWAEDSCSVTARASTFLPERLKPAQSRPMPGPELSTPTTPLGRPGAQQEKPRRQTL